MKKLLTAALLASAAIALPAVAAPNTYKLSGTFTGTLAGNPFTVFATFTGLADTANSFSAFGNPAVTAFSLSSLTALTGQNQTFTITTPTFFYTYGPGQYGNALSRLGLSFDNSGVNALGLESPAYSGYDGRTSFPNTPGSTYFQNAQFETNGGTVVISNFSGGSFQALGAVPEPATWGMMILGFGAVGYGMRRRRKVSAKVHFA